MTTYSIDPAELKALHGKTILITGAATGIGEAAFKLAIGAWEVYIDWFDYVCPRRD